MRANSFCLSDERITQVKYFIDRLFFFQGRTLELEMLHLKVQLIDQRSKVMMQWRTSLDIDLVVLSTRQTPVILILIECILLVCST